MPTPSEYLNILQQVQEKTPIEQDFYGEGGVTKKLEERFAKLTGKEKAIYLPTGTMANQLRYQVIEWR